MGGFPSLTIDGDLKVTCGLLENNGLKIASPEQDEGQSFWQGPARNVLESVWRVTDGKTELSIHEATYLRRGDDSVHLIFIPLRTREEERLHVRIQDILVAAGASIGAKKRN